MTQAGVKDIPTGSLRARKLGVGLAAVCADPIYLAADLEDAQLFPSASLAISEADTSALLGDLNNLVADDGLTFAASSLGEWVLYGEGLQALQPSTLDCLPAHALAHRNVAHRLPRATNAGAWRRLFTEVQMLLHTHPVNDSRRAIGQLPINAVWFWGAGPWPSADVVNVGVQRRVVHTNDGWTRELCQALEVPVTALDESTSYAALLNQHQYAAGHQLIVDTAIYTAFLAGHSTELYQQRRAWLNHIWQPLELALKRSELPAIRVLDGEGRTAIAKPRSGGLYGLWQRFKGNQSQTPVFDLSAIEAARSHQ